MVLDSGAHLDPVIAEMGLQAYLSTCDGCAQAVLTPALLAPVRPGSLAQGAHGAAPSSLGTTLALLPFLSVSLLPLAMLLPSPLHACRALLLTVYLRHAQPHLFLPNTLSPNFSYFFLSASGLQNSYLWSCDRSDMMDCGDILRETDHLTGSKLYQHVND